MAGSSDLSEWPRSIKSRESVSPKILSGTATGIVRRVDDLGRIVIPKEIRRTLKIREGDPLLTTLTPFNNFCVAMRGVVNRYNK